MVGDVYKVALRLNRNESWRSSRVEAPCLNAAVYERSAHGGEESLYDVITVRWTKRSCCPWAAVTHSTWSLAQVVMRPVKSPPVSHKHAQSTEGRWESMAKNSTSSVPSFASFLCIKYGCLHSQAWMHDHHYWSVNICCNQGLHQQKYCTVNSKIDRKCSKELMANKYLSVVINRLDRWIHDYWWKK